MELGMYQLIVHVSTIAADDLATTGARSSSAMVLTQFSWIIQVPS